MSHPSPPLPLSFDAMNLEDLPVILDLEQRCFPQPWTENMYRYELTSNRYCAYWVLRPDPARLPIGPDGCDSPPILAYGGYWIMGDEAHIVTLATHPSWRRRRLAMWLLLQMCARIREQGVDSVTLEVRRENEPAIRLYESLGFAHVGERRNYYGRGQDALLMTLAGLQEAPVWARLQESLAITSAGVVQALAAFLT